MVQKKDVVIFPEVRDPQTPQTLSPNGKNLSRKPTAGFFKGSQVLHQRKIREDINCEQIKRRHVG